MESGTRSSVIPSSRSATQGLPPTDTSSDVREMIEDVTERVCERSPMLGEIIKKYGHKSLLDFSEKLFYLTTPAFYSARREEFLSIVIPLVEKRLGKEKAAEVRTQLLETSLVSTTDHHAFIQHPYWINSCLITALPYAAAKDPRMTSVIAFSFATVSLNNASGFPKGLIFHGKGSGEGETIKLPIFPDRDKMNLVYGERAFTREDLHHASEVLEQKVEEGLVSAERAAGVKKIIDEVFMSDDVLQSADFNEQITKLNAKVWPTLFAPAKNGPEVPGLLYLEIETIVRELMYAYHLDNAESAIHQLLFTKQGNELSDRFLDGVPGVYSREHKTGTYFFWALTEKGRRTALMPKDGNLVSADGEVSIPLNPESIRKALQDKHIMPSMGLCYLLVAFHYGFTCLGGFCQIRDLTLLRDAWVELLRTEGRTDEALAVQDVDTMFMSAGGNVLAYIRTSHDTLVPGTGIDFLLEPKLKKSFGEYVEIAKHFTFMESMCAMLPDTYKVFYAEAERDPALLQYSAEDITGGMGLASHFPTVL